MRETEDYTFLLGNSKDASFAQKLYSLFMTTENVCTG